MVREGHNRSTGLGWAVLALFAIVSIVATFPLVAGFGSHVLGAPAPGDGFQYVYLLRWLKDSLFGDRPWAGLLFDPDVFYPFGYNLALSETTLSNGVLALPLTTLFGEVAAYNGVILLSFVLSGLGAYLLVQYHTGDHLAGLLSGLASAFCPYRMSHLGAGHLPLMGTQWLPLLLLYVDKTIVERRPSAAAMAGFFYALGALSSWYYAYMFGLVTLLYVLVRGWPWRQHLWRREFVAFLVVFAVVSVVLVGPVVLPVTGLWSEGGRPHSLRYVDQFSASPLDFLVPTVMHPLWGAPLLTFHAPNIHENLLCLGVVPLALALLGLRRGGYRRYRAFVWMSLVFAVLAMGTTLHWKGGPLYIQVPSWLERAFTAAMGFLTTRLALYPVSSYALRLKNAVYVPLPTLLLYLYLPFFSAMRVWARFGLITVLGTSVLAGYGLHRLLQSTTLGGPLVPGRARALLLKAAFCGLVMLDFAAFPFALGSSRVQAQSIDRWLAQQPGDFAVMVYPLRKALSGPPLYGTVVHGKKVAYGYGTFFPRGFEEQREILESFPSAESLVVLREWQVRYVLVGSRSYGADWPRVRQALSSASGLRHVTTLEEMPLYEGDRLLHLLPGMERALIVDRILVYELL